MAITHRGRTLGGERRPPRLSLRRGEPAAQAQVPGRTPREGDCAAFLPDAAGRNVARAPRVGADGGGAEVGARVAVHARVIGTLDVGRGSMLSGRASRRRAPASG